MLWIATFIAPVKRLAYPPSEPKNKLVTGSLWEKGMGTYDQENNESIFVYRS
jgi:hypothetical protein